MGVYPDMRRFKCGDLVEPFYHATLRVSPESTLDSSIECEHRGENVVYLPARAEQVLVPGIVIGESYRPSLHAVFVSTPFGMGWTQSRNVC